MTSPRASPTRKDSDADERKAILSLVPSGSSSPEPGPSEEKTLATWLAKQHPPLRESDADEDLKTTTHDNPAAAINPMNLDLATLNQVFENASLASPQATRILLSFPSQAELNHPAAMRLGHDIGPWSLVGVVQSTHDVCFVVKIPIHKSTDPRSMPEYAQLDLYYDPVRDDCVIHDQNPVPVSLQRIGPESSKIDVRPHQISVLHPGLWRLFWREHEYVLDMLILRRYFTVAINEPKTDVASGKRKARDEPTNVARAKRSKHEKEEKMEILLFSPTRLLQKTVAANAATNRGTPLLRLGIDETVRVGLSTQQHELLDGDAEQAGPSPAIVTSPHIYDITRLEGVFAATSAARVFTAQHTKHEGTIVAKVVRYSGDTTGGVIHCARRWLREVQILQRLNHKNVLSLKSCDGRLFAIYVEHLPAHLQRGLTSPFSPSDAYVILQDMSSALSYLKQQRVVHNDVRPCNITYSPQRGAVLIDFGLATDESEKASDLGTPWYIPPEYVDHEESRNRCGDVWALGVTMLYVLKKILLPEQCEARWSVRDTRLKRSQAHQRMRHWMAQLAFVREQFNPRYFMEGLVYRMLEQDHEKRIRPAELVAAFDDDAVARPISRELLRGSLGTG